MTWVSAVRRVVGIGAVVTLLTALPVPAGGQAEPSVVAEAAALTRAVALGRPVEVTALTTETRQVIANPAGTFTLTASARPVRVRRGDGWTPVDLTLVRGSDGTVAPAASATPMTFSSGGSAPLVRIADGSSAVSLTWAGTLPAPVLASNTATYANVLPDVDLILTADVDGFGEVLVVKTSAAASSPRLRELRFGLSTTGVTAARDAAGNIDFRDSRGEVAFHAPTPVMWDSHGTVAGKATEPGEAAVQKPVGLDISANALTLTPDIAMLGSPATQFPLYIDPSLSAGRRAWTTAWQKFPTTSYWNSSENIARVGHESDEGNTYTPKPPQTPPPIGVREKVPNPVPGVSPAPYTAPQVDPALAPAGPPSWVKPVITVVFWVAVAILVFLLLPELVVAAPVVALTGA